MSPWLSVIIPTIGRPTLERTLQSIRSQRSADDVEILIVGDSHNGTWAKQLADLSLMAARSDALYVDHDGGQHCWGHPQRQYGAELADGEWLAFLQDDDVYAHGAFDAIEAGTRGQDALCPVLFRATVPAGIVVWMEPVIRENNIDANCIVTPNRPKQIGRWGHRYAGDFDFVQSTAELYDGQVAWDEHVIALARPL